MARRSRGNARGRGGNRRGGGRQQQQDSFQVTGEIVEIFEKRYGRDTLFNLVLDDDESYGFGRDLEGADEGDTITFDAYENAKGYLTKVDGTVEVGASGGGRAGRSKPANGGNKRGRKGNDADSKRRSKESIVYEGARDAAQRTLHFLVSEGVMKIGAKNAKPQDREAIYWGLLDDLTATFFEEVETQAALNRAENARGGGQDDPDDAGEPDRNYDD